MPSPKIQRKSIGGFVLLGRLTSAAPLLRGTMPWVAIKTEWRSGFLTLCLTYLLCVDAKHKEDTPNQPTRKNWESEKQNHG